MYHIVIKKPSQNSLSKLVIVEKFINAIETKPKSRLAIGGSFFTLKTKGILK